MTLSKLRTRLRGGRTSGRPLIQTLNNRDAHARIIDAARVVFNVGGNKCRLVVKVGLSGRTIWIHPPHS